MYKMYKICVFFCVSISLVISIDVVPISRKKWAQPYSLHYDAPTNSLFFSDYVDRTINRFDLDENHVYTASIENDIASTFIIPLKGFKNRYVVSDKLTVTVIEWDGKEKVAGIVRDEFSVEKTGKYKSNNWNIAKASPSCTFYGGTFRGELCSENPGASAFLYRYTRSNGPKHLLRCLKLSGGIDWNINENLFYHADSCNEVIREFDYDPKTGNIENGRIVHHFDNFGDDAIVPLGMTIDTHGYLYVASYFGSEVLKIDPRTSKVIKRIKIPAEAVSSVAFGGPDLDILFVATERVPFNTTTGTFIHRPVSSESGSIFMVKGLKARGLPGRKLRL